MAYDSALPDDRNWVRFLVGDTSTSPVIPDDTIDAVLAEEDNKYLAAARVGEAMFATWTESARGMSEKQVGELRIRFGEGANALAAYRKYLEGLREHGARLTYPTDQAHMFSSGLG